MLPSVSWPCRLIYLAAMSQNERILREDHTIQYGHKGMSRHVRSTPHVDGGDNIYPQAALYHVRMDCEVNYCAAGFDKRVIEELTCCLVRKNLYTYHSKI